MKLVPIPIEMLPVGQPLPVDIWNPAGVLLLRKGQQIDSEQDRAKLYKHQASATEAEAQAWQRAYERMVHKLLQEGADVQDIARMPMPSAIRERDYQTSDSIKGGWPDLQEVLRGMLYHGGLAIKAGPRLLAIESKVMELVNVDADDSLFCLFQALSDKSTGDTATHALLCAVLCELAGQKMGIKASQRQALMGAALTMNIGMAREHDVLARQSGEPSQAQRELIRNHPKISEQILLELGIDDDELLDIVRWHHEPESPDGLPHTLGLRRLLHMTDVFVAKMASRRTRDALPPLLAAKSVYLESADGVNATAGTALTSVAGFYPPGTYVKLVSGEIAVSVQRGVRANTPRIIIIVDKDGMPAVNYVCHDSADPMYAIASADLFLKGKVVLNAEKVRQARARSRL